MKTKLNNIAFQAEVNPFLRTVILKRQSTKGDWSKVFQFEELDEWETFEYDNCVYDMHFYYKTEESKFYLSAYEIIEGNVSYQESVKIKVKFVF